MIVFLGLSTNTGMDAATPLPLPIPVPAHQDDASKQALTVQGDDTIHVLSAKDATLYRAAFAAQEQGDMNEADLALAEIKDKKLVGHVLADRYLGHAMSLAEAGQWMTSYADLPEAEAVYDQARGLKGFTAAHLKSPLQVVSWTGNNGSNLSSGFRGENDGDVHKSRIDLKINATLRHGDPMAAREMLATEIQRGTLSVGGRQRDRQ